MNASEATPKVERYRVPMHGGGIEDLDRFAVRDRIRAGEIVESTELAHAGTDAWKRASEFPELSRYFQLVPAARPAAPTASTTRVFEPMAHRVVAGLAYPFAHGGIITMLALAVFSCIPVLGIFAIPVASVYVLTVIRESAKGDTRMPGWFETSDLTEVLITWLKTVAVTLIAAWPVIAWLFLWASTTSNIYDRGALLRLLTGLVVSGLVALVYYPACLVTVAVWHSVLDGLNPAYVARVIKTVAADYSVVVGVWMAVWVGTLVLQGFAGALFDWIPLFGDVPARVVAIWGQLYVAHLLGYAVYRHTDELGWG